MIDDMIDVYILNYARPIFYAPKVNTGVGHGHIYQREELYQHNQLRDIEKNPKVKVKSDHFYELIGITFIIQSIIGKGNWGGEIVECGGILSEDANEVFGEYTHKYNILLKELGLIH